MMANTIVDTNCAFYSVQKFFQQDLQIIKELLQCCMNDDNLDRNQYIDRLINFDEHAVEAYSLVRLINHNYSILPNCCISTFNVTLVLQYLWGELNIPANPKIVKHLLNIVSIAIIEDENLAKTCLEKIFTNDLNEHSFPVLKMVLFTFKKLDKTYEFVTNQIIDELTQLLFREHRKIQLQIIECTTMLLASSDHKDYLSKKLWQMILADQSQQGTFILCSFANKLIPDMANDLQNAAVVNLLQTAILSDSNIKKKEAIYILQLMINSTNAKSVEGWQTFCTLVENLEEKQSHLILPTLGMIQKLRCLKQSWYHVIVQMILQHENKLVQLWGINHILVMKLEDFKKLKLEMFFHCLFQALNKTSLDPNLKLDELCKFQNEFLFHFMTNITLVENWLSAPLYKILKILEVCIHSSQKWLRSNANTFINELKQFFQKLTISISNCQNVLIRYGLQNLLYKMLKHFSIILQKQDTCIILKQIYDINPDNYLNTEFINSYQMDYEDIKIFSNKDLGRFLAKKYSLTEIAGMKNVEKTHFLLFLQYTSDNAKPNHFNSHLISFSEDVEKLLNYSNKSFVEAMINERLVTKDCVPFLEIINEKCEEFINNQEIGFEAKYAALHCTKLISLIPGIYKNSRKIEEGHTRLAKRPIITFPNTKIDGKILADVYVFQAEILFSVQEICDFQNEWDLVQEKVITFIDIGGKDILTILMKLMQIPLNHIVINEIHDSHIINLSQSVIERLYKELETIRRSDHYRKCLNSFVQMIFGSGLKLPILEPLLENLLFSEIPPKADLVYFVLLELFKNNINYLQYRDIILKCLIFGLLYGDIPKKDHKIENEIEKQILENHSYKDFELDINSKVRAVSISFLHHPFHNLQNDRFAKWFCDNAKTLLKEKYLKLCKSKTRYFNDSQHHRNKLRVIQILAMLIESTEDDKKFIQQILLNQHNQLNISYIIELIAVDILSFQEIFSVFNKATQTAEIQSFIMIIWMKYNKENNLRPDLSLVIREILPYTMDQKIATRLIAAFILRHIIRMDKDRNKYFEIEETLDKLMRQQGFKISPLSISSFDDKMYGDFRFRGLNFAHLRSLNNIFYYIPKLTMMASDELITTKAIRCESYKINVPLSMGVDDFALENACYNRSSNTTITSKDLLNLDEENEINIFDNVQKKTIPLKYLTPDFHYLTSLPKEMQLKKMENKEGLIVVASLITRIPNLGGLARTSEIFGAKMLTISSFKHQEQEDFQALSMSAEKWLNVMELKKWHVYDYLIKMKEEGYSIVGAEQTCNSQNIFKLNFPKKTILLLGHEKEGIPANLIALLDLCVEIPIYGVIRSLNVHVTGAIFMYEYAKQHVFN